MLFIFIITDRCFTVDIVYRAAYHGHLDIAKLLMVYGADLNVMDSAGNLLIDIAATEAITQAIRDEPRRRIDEALGMRATEQEQHLDVTASASAHQQEGDDEKEDEGKKQPAIRNEPERRASQQPL